MANRHGLFRSHCLMLDVLEERTVPAYILGGPANPLTTSGSWSWDAGGTGYMDSPNGYRTAVLDANYFGPAGTVPITITTTNLPAINAATLATVDGFISCWWDDASLSAPALSAIVNFFLTGGDLILLNDDSGHDRIAETLGIPTVSGAGTVSNGGVPLFDGPFGTTSNVVQTGSVGCLAAADIAAHNGHPSGTNTLGQITSAFWNRGDYAPGAGRMLIVADVDMWSSYGTATYYPLNNNGIFALNGTAFIVNPSDVTLTQSGGFTSASEGGATDTYTLQLNTAPTANVIVTLTPDAQVTVAPTTVTFTPTDWNIPQTATVSAVDDPSAELSPHSGIITHTTSSADPLYQNISVASITTAITDNDPPGVAIDTGGTVDVTEAGATDAYTVTLVSLPTADVVVTITPDSQQTAAPSPLTFTPLTWNTPQTVAVTAVDDFIAQGTRQGMITHSSSSLDPLYNALAIYSPTVTVSDNDTAGVTIAASGGSTSVTEGGASDTYTVVLNTPPTATVTVTFSPDAQLTVSSGNLFFDAFNWNVPQTVTVSAVNDPVIEGAHTGAVAHSASSGDAGYNGLAMATLTANVTDNDIAAVMLAPTGASTDVVELGATDTYTIALATQPAANVVVTVGAATQVTVSAATVTFTPLSWNSPATITVTAVDDVIVQGAHLGTIAHSVSSTDPNYAGLSAATLTVNIADNDVAGVVAASTGASTDVSEDGATDTYTVRLATQPATSVVVNVGSSPLLVMSPTSLVFTPANWNVPQTISVAGLDDAIVQGPHTGTIMHTTTSTDPFYASVSAGPFTVNIIDNDMPGLRFTLTNGSLTVVEGTSQSYTVVMTTPPTADVVVSPSPNAQVAVAPATLTFTPANWFVPQPFVLTGVDDTIIEGSHVGVASHVTTSTDAAYNNLATTPLTARIVDNDGPTIAGTDKADRIVVAFTAQNIQVNVNNRIMLLPGTSGQTVILAGGGADHIEVFNPTVPVVVLGGAGSDRMFVNGQGAFRLDAGSINVRGFDVSLWDVEALVVNGSTSNDTFTVAEVPAFATEFKGDLGNDTVVAADQSNVWNITSANGGVLNSRIKLNGVENWTGGAAADTFRFGAGKSLTGVIDGGGGNDTLDYALVTAAVTVNLETATATGVKSFANIARFVGGKNAADRLIAANQGNTWTITAPNTGDVGGLLFQGIENLTGGSGDDMFLFAANSGIKGKIDGGGGDDMLDFSGYTAKPVVINLQARTATGLGGFLNIEQFQGGAGSGDNLIGANVVNLWSLTGAGAGSLGSVAFAEFENLTGGSQADTFLLQAAGDWLGLLNGNGGQDRLTAFPGVNLWINTSPTAGTLNGRRFQSIEVRL